MLGFSRKDHADCSEGRRPRRVRTLGSGKKPRGGIEALGPYPGMGEVGSVSDVADADLV